MEEIDISTNQLCEQVAESLPARLTFDTVLAVWHAVGTVVKTQMSQKRGVRLDKLGMFTFSRSGAPIFNVAQDFSALYRVNQVATPAMDTISSNKLNLTQLQQVPHTTHNTHTYAHYTRVVLVTLRPFPLSTSPRLPTWTVRRRTRCTTSSCRPSVNARRVAAAFW